MIDIILSGACGKMGKEILSLIRDDEKFNCLFGIDRMKALFPCPLYASFDEAPAHPGGSRNAVLVDFSHPSALDAILSYAKRNTLPAVLGSTGYSDEQLRSIRDAAKEIPVFYSSNMSVGIYVLGKLAKEASLILRECGFDIEIVEKHHGQKKDAPSGTAKTLYQLVANEENYAVYDRHEKTEARSVNEIGIHSVRGGTVAGEHEIGFYGNGETILLQHTAQNRTIFAAGALRAANFISKMPAGLYGMDDLFSQTLRAGSV